MKNIKKQDYDSSQKELMELYYEVASALEEEQGKNKKLTARVNRDFENSSIPSSMKIKRKKITNSREKTGRRPGGQPGHAGHRRKQCTPTSSHEIPAPERYADNPDFKPTGKTIRKQKINLHTTITVWPLGAPIWPRFHGNQKRKTFQP